MVLSQLGEVNYTYQCVNCGTIFGSKNVRHNKRTFCSKECSDEYQRNGEIVSCATCGKLVYRNKSRIENYSTFYCSSECCNRDEVTRKRISEKMQGNTNQNWDSRDNNLIGQRISNSKMGHEVSYETRKKLSELNRGANCYFYKDGRSTERQLFYRSFEWRSLAKQVRKQDNYKCQKCGKKAVHVHHIIPLSVGGPNELWNLMTLCKSCHAKIENQKGFIKI